MKNGSPPPLWIWKIQLLKNIRNNKKAAEGTLSRIALIDKTGKVLNDSAIAYEDMPKLENHAERDEFRNAALNYPSYEMRQSRSAGKNFVYYAAKAGDGENSPVIRISYDNEYPDNLEKSLLVQSFAIAAALMIAVAIISAYLARKFSAPVKDPKPSYQILKK